MTDLERDFITLYRSLSEEGKRQFLEIVQNVCEPDAQWDDDGLEVWEGGGSMGSLPEKIKVTFSREDGSPLFPHEEAPQEVYLEDTKPVLVVVREDDALMMNYGDQQDALKFIEDLMLPY